ncbi:hypothetical protein K502DRAFT_322872 [Neoconidiobolus thromboides FSU 785]|nr:hypothetical protein K502DRAFT_322872 [Neoconidiobolus thromboides FSU 785]
MLEDINRQAQASENAQQLLELSRQIDLHNYPDFKLNGLTRNLGPRQAIIDGPVNKHKSGRQLHAFLFNDLLLITQPNSNSNIVKYTLYLPVSLFHFLINNLT